MPLALDFIPQMRQAGPLAGAYVALQFEDWWSRLASIFPLVDGLNTSVSSLQGNAIIGLSGYPVSSLLQTDSAGAPAFAATLPMPIAFIAGVEISPAVLSGNTNNYNPTGLATAAILRVSASGAYNLTGLVAATTRRLLLLINVGTTNTITLTNLDSASAAANRFRCPGLVNKTLTAGSTLWLWYDITGAVWQIVES